MPQARRKLPTDPAELGGITKAAVLLMSLDATVASNPLGNCSPRRSRK